MLEFGGALDAWLEAPYVDAARREQELEAWAEANDEDLSDPQALDRFEEFVASWEQDVPEPPDDWDVDPRDLD